MLSNAFLYANRSRVDIAREIEPDSLYNISRPREKFPFRFYVIPYIIAVIESARNALVHNRVDLSAW